MKISISTKYAKILIIVLFVLLAGIGSVLVWYSRQPDNEVNKVSQKSLNSSHSDNHSVSGKRINDSHRSEPKNEQEIDASPEEIEKAIAYLDSLDSNQKTQKEKQSNESSTDTGGKQSEVDEEIEREELLQEIASFGFDKPEQQEKLRNLPTPVLKAIVEEYKKVLEEARKQYPGLLRQRGQ